MNFALLLLLAVDPLAAPPLVTSDGEEVEVEAPRWTAPPDGFRFGGGPHATVNVRVNTDLAGVSVGAHVEVAFKRAWIEARLAAAVTAFAGWNGDAGFGWLITGSMELSARVYFWRMLAFGAGVAPGVSVGEAQNCSVSIFPGSSGCSPNVKYLYGSVAPVIYPIAATLGADGRHDLALQLSWPVALEGSYTFPSVMVRYSRTF